MADNDANVPSADAPDAGAIRLDPSLTQAQASLAAYYLPSQVWSGTFLDSEFGWYDMTSAAPPSASKAEMLAKRIGLQDLEARVRADVIGKSQT